MQRTMVDTTTATFSARLAAILRAARDDQGRSVRSLVWASRGTFRRGALRALESGQGDLRGVDLASLAALYRIDLGELLQERVPVRADLEAGTIATAGLVRSFTPGDSDALLVTYLGLVRDLRDLRTAPSIALRRGDVETLAAALRSEAIAVLDRLGQLMGSTVTQRRSAVAMFLAGAALIVLSTGAVALPPGSHEPAAHAEAGPEVAISLVASADERIVHGPPVAPPAGADVSPPVDGPPVVVESPVEAAPVDPGPTDLEAVPRDGSAGTPGNSPEVGNTPIVGQPGNSGNVNAGGGAASAGHHA